MNKNEILKAKELCEQAYPGPWRYLRDIKEVLVRNDDIVCRVGSNGIPKPDYNGEFIAQSRTLLPKALAYIGELEAKFNVAWDALDDIATAPGEHLTSEMAKEAMKKIEIQCVRYEEVR